MSIGLESGALRLAPHSPDWAERFVQEKERLLDALGPRAVEVRHVGSTAVAGLPAKPIIDIAIAVKSSHVVHDCVGAIEALGYEYLGEYGIPGRHYLRKGAPLRTHHIHMYADGHPGYAALVLFRDTLRRRPDVRDAYAALKGDLVARHAGDREAYTNAKGDFIRRVTGEAGENADPAHALDHDLAPHFPRLRGFRTTGALHASPFYAGLRREVDALLGTVLRADDAPAAPKAAAVVTALAWNIERGRRLDDVLRVLDTHPQASQADLFLLTELDVGMARSGNHNVPLEIAHRLGLNVAFAPCYLNLGKGSGLEATADGDNRQALHGNALFSRHPLHGAFSIPLPNGKDKLRSREQRLGSQRAVAAVVDHPAGRFRAVSVHLDAHSTRGHRRRQMGIVLDTIDSIDAIGAIDRREPRLPVLVGGDWNTTTHNSKHGIFAIAGFYRRVLMGVRNVLRNHYPHPDRWFERALFEAVERRGYDYRSLNVPGGCTLSYDVVDLAQNSGMADWIPKWCFWWIDWALKEHAGRCALKLDWFAGRDLDVVAGSPRVLDDLSPGRGKISDHEPIYVQFTPRSILPRDAVSPAGS